MDFRQLRYFVAVAEELSFSRAAVRLNVTQPPLSIQIKAMEDELGTSLLTRTRHSVELTEAGRLLLNYARGALLKLDQAGELVRRAGRGEAGLIRMGFVGSVPMLDLFAYLMQGFRGRHPLVEIDLQHLNTSQQIKALAEDKLDVAFFRPAKSFQPGRLLHVHRSWTDRLMVYLPANHRLADQGEGLTPDDLSSENFVGIAADVGCGVHDTTMRLWAEAGLMPRMVQEARDLRTLLWLVAAGLGVAVLPECYGRAGVANVTSVPLLSPGNESQVMMATRAGDISPLLQLFVEHARQFNG